MTKKHKIILFAVAVILVLFTVDFVRMTVEEHRQFSISYEVTGSVPVARISYFAGDYHQREIEEPLPWRITFQATRKGMISVIASTMGEYGSVTASVYVDGALIETSTGIGPLGLASADAFIR